MSGQSSPDSILFSKNYSKNCVPYNFEQFLLVKHEKASLWLKQAKQALRAWIVFLRDAEVIEVVGDPANTGKIKRGELAWIARHNLAERLTFRDELLQALAASSGLSYSLFFNILGNGIANKRLLSHQEAFRYAPQTIKNDDAQSIKSFPGSTGLFLRVINQPFKGPGAALDCGSEDYLFALEIMVDQTITHSGLGCNIGHPGPGQPFTRKHLCRSHKDLALLLLADTLIAFLSTCHLFLVL